MPKIVVVTISKKLPMAYHLFNNTIHFFKCGDRSSGKMTNQIKSYNKSPNHAIIPGGRFNMDFRFVRGTSTTNNEDGSLITSKDGKNCYILIVDEFNRHLWVFLFANKNPLPPRSLLFFVNW